MSETFRASVETALGMSGLVGTDARRKRLEFVEQIFPERLAQARKFFRAGKQEFGEFILQLFSFDDEIVIDFLREKMFEEDWLSLMDQKTFWGVAVGLSFARMKNDSSAPLACFSSALAQIFDGLSVSPMAGRSPLLIWRSAGQERTMEAHDLNSFVDRLYESGLGPLVAELLQKKPVTCPALISCFDERNRKRIFPDLPTEPMRDVRRNLGGVFSLEVEVYR